MERLTILVILRILHNIVTLCIEPYAQWDSMLLFWLNNYFGSSYSCLNWTFFEYMYLSTQENIPSSLNFAVLDIFPLKLQLSIRKETVIISFAKWFLNDR